MAPQLLTVREAAERLRVSTAIVYRLAGAGELEHVRVGSALRFTQNALAAFLGRSRRGGR